jgi:hypothetical protein
MQLCFKWCFTYSIYFLSKPKSLENFLLVYLT